MKGTLNCAQYRRTRNLAGHKHNLTNSSIQYQAWTPTKQLGLDAYRVCTPLQHQLDPKELIKKKNHDF